ncbi:metallophosphoesterase [Cyanobium sp. NIES-981]|uniref:metallophosphoesterase n=1 Tax=Cyanobium sp. NIES-981 TaxID=1851505 RepID=UPI0007DD6C70|nr:metallophosphoesterase [Cyanobium sp. NIES-981]SBO44631.1 3',5'-cyclic adenosine monophosphate phosphodiesterase CpdA [Cyanobium sp. NIES-981]
MHVLQLSDPHLLAGPTDTYRGRRPMQWLAQGLRESLALVPQPPDLLLLSGDLCQDESLGGYVNLRRLLEPLAIPLALLPGNHDHPMLLRVALGRTAVIAPALLQLNGARLLLLDSHKAGATAGWLGTAQLRWVAERLGQLREDPARLPLLVAVHHPPVPIGDPVMDAIALLDGQALLRQLRQVPELVAVVFGHIHQHWAGSVPGRPEVPLLGCPSTLCGFGPVQPCPLGRPGDPGGRWLVAMPEGGFEESLLRWLPP